MVWRKYGNQTSPGHLKNAFSPPLSSQSFCMEAKHGPWHRPWKNLWIAAIQGCFEPPLTSLGVTILLMKSCILVFHRLQKKFDHADSACWALLPTSWVASTWCPALATKKRQQRKMALRWQFSSNAAARLRNRNEWGDANTPGWPKPVAKHIGGSAVAARVSEWVRPSVYTHWCFTCRKCTERGSLGTYSN